MNEKNFKANVSSISFERPIMCLLFSVVFIIACNTHKGSFKEIKDHGLTIQIIKTIGEPRNDHAINYSARLVPDKGLISEKDAKVKTELWYGMDSCFYLQSGKKRVYPEIIQPIANGVAGSFEYMVSFESTDLKDGKWNLVYQDKYLNHRKYQMDSNLE